MKRLRKLLNERTGEKAHRDAVAMGLKYKGFGYWVDPNTGKVTHKTENDELVPVDPDVESDKWKGDAEMPGAGGMGAKQGTPADMAARVMGTPQAPLGQGIMGTAAPGLAQAARRLSWQPGADGDTCVDSDNPKPEVPDDTFVGKTNYYQWTAGPDGSNYKNLSFSDMFADLRRKNDKEATLAQQPPGVMEDVQKSLSLTKAGKNDPNEYSRAVDRMGRIMGDKTATNYTDKGAQSAMRKLKDHPTILANQVNSMLGIANQSKRYSGQDTFDHEQGKKAAMWRKALKLPAIAKDADKVKQMNDAARPFFSDPKFDLDQFNEDESMGEGAFGQVFLTPDGQHVIKKGKIGVDELKALHAMRDNPNFPTLVNGRFDTPFINRSSQYNNPIDADDERANTEGEYWDPDEQYDWDKKFPTAEGTYAMTRAQGAPLFERWDYLTDEQKKKATQQFWNARRAMHLKGYSHNDMHGGNIMMDYGGNLNIIDLGLAKDDPVSALMEALGGADPEQGGDYQLARDLSGANMDPEVMEQFQNNRYDIEEALRKEYIDDQTFDDEDEDGYSPNRQYLDTKIVDMLRGNIRMTREELDNLREDLPILQDRGRVLKLIKQLYGDVGDTPLERRMAVAFDKKKADLETVERAQRMQKERGVEPFQIKNKSIVPRRALDIDD